jgi:hypothetical protein
MPGAVHLLLAVTAGMLAGSMRGIVAALRDRLLSGPRPAGLEGF